MPIPGSNIRLLREQHGLSLRSLATAAQVEVSVLSKLERGLGGYSKEGIERIARELGVSLGVLFAEPEMVEAAALRMRRVPLIDVARLRTWTGNDDLDAEQSQAFLHVSLERGSRHTFAVALPDQANAPEFRKGDEVIFDAARQPTSKSFVVAQDSDGRTFFGRFRLLDQTKEGHSYEVLPYDLTFPIGSTKSASSLKIRGIAIELRRQLPK